MLTAATTDEDINGEGPGSLTNAVIQVEKTLKKNLNVESPLAPRQETC